jgi:hypothetical protein
MNRIKLDPGCWSHVFDVQTNNIIFTSDDVYRIGVESCQVPKLSVDVIAQANYKKGKQKKRNTTQKVTFM